MATTQVTPSIPLGLKGQASKESFGNGGSIPRYAPTYPMFGPKDVWKWLDSDIVLIDYTTDAAAAAEVLPAECNLVGIPIAPGQAAIKLVFAKYRGGTLPPYYEVIQSIPCVYKGELFLFVYQIWVDTDSAMTSGRELGGYPKKLADIGLVTDSTEGHSLLGTEGFIPEEGSGSVRADIYSLGKVLYEMSTGRDRNDYPALPEDLGNGAEARDLILLNKIILKACRPKPWHRYQTAEEMLSTLLAFQFDQRLENRRQFHHIVGIVGVIVAAIVIIVMLGRIVWLLEHGK